MKRSFFFALLFITAIVAESVCPAKGNWVTQISCPSYHHDYSIDIFTQNGQNFIGLAVLKIGAQCGCQCGNQSGCQCGGQCGNQYGDQYGNILTKVPLEDISVCSYDNPYAEVGGGKPLIYKKEIGETSEVTKNLHYLDPQETNLDEMAAFTCLCRFNFNLLDGCTAEIFDTEKDYDDRLEEYWSFYSCNGGFIDKKVTKKKIIFKQRKHSFVPFI